MEFGIILIKKEPNLKNRLVKTFDSLDRFDFKYKEIFLLSNRKYIVINENELYGVIDTNGKIIIPVEYKNIYHDYNKNYIAVNITGFDGVLDKNGNIIIPFEYKIIKLHDGIYKCFINHIMFYFNKNGKLLGKTK